MWCPPTNSVSHSGKSNGVLLVSAKAQIKNIKNDNNALLFANLVLKHSDKVSVKDIEIEQLTKLYSMSLKSQLASVRFFAIQNLTKDSDHFNNFKIQLSELRNTEKNEKVLELLNTP